MITMNSMESEKRIIESEKKIIETMDIILEHAKNINRTLDNQTEKLFVLDNYVESLTMDMEIANDNVKKVIANDNKTVIKGVAVGALVSATGLGVLGLVSINIPIIVVSGAISFVSVLVMKNV